MHLPRNKSYDPLLHQWHLPCNKGYDPLLHQWHLPCNKVCDPLPHQWHLSCNNGYDHLLHQWHLSCNVRTPRTWCFTLTSRRTPHKLNKLIQHKIRHTYMSNKTELKYNKTTQVSSNRY